MALVHFFGDLASRSTETWKPTVVLVGSGIMNTPDDDTHSYGAQAGYLGICRTARSEYESIDVRLIDVQASGEEEAGRALTAEDASALSAVFGWIQDHPDLSRLLGPEIAIRRGEVYLPRLVPLDPCHTRTHSSVGTDASAAVSLNVASPQEGTAWKGMTQLVQHAAKQQSEVEFLVLLEPSAPLVSGENDGLPAGVRITYASSCPSTIARQALQPCFRPTHDKLCRLPNEDPTAPNLFDYAHFDVILVSASSADLSKAASCLLPGSMMLVTLEPGSEDAGAEAVAAELSRLGLSVTRTDTRGGILAAARPDASGTTVTPAASSDIISDGDRGCFVVTGGTGGLGLLSAQHLIRQGATRVVLLSRSGRPAPGCEQLLQEVLSNKGAEVHVAEADISDASALSRLRETLRQRQWLPVRGIVHAAGVLADATLARLDAGSFDVVNKPKIVGTRRLLEHLCGDPHSGDVEFFVGFSSVATLLGLPAQASYAAANAQLDAIVAQMRVVHGIPAATVQLGGVSDVGMSARVADHVHAWGVGQIASGDFGEMLQKVIQMAKLPRHRTLVGANLDWKTLHSTRKPQQNRLLSAFLPTPHKPASQKRVQQQESSNGASTTAVLQPAMSLEEVEQIVNQTLEDVAGLQVGKEESLYECGLDSLSAVQFRNVLAQRFEGVELAPTLVFDYPTVDHLTQYIHQQLQQRAAAARPPPPPQPIPSVPATNGLPTSNGGDMDGAVAVIGVEARMPGSANSFDEFWANLCAGVDGICDVPYARFDADDYLDDNQLAGGKTAYVLRAGFVDGVEWFDHERFGITPMEAKVMDPSQRVMLETAHRAFAAAGYDKDALKGSKTGVFVGSLSPDWRQVLTEHTAYSGTGSALSIIANRVSYVLGLVGPSMAIDTACSSSLVAMHLALQSIRAGQCEMALVGGVQTILNVAPFINGCKARMLSPDAHCKSFDASADGYVKAEGCGALVIKDLAAARRDGDRILALVRGSAVNQDGRSANLTTPYGPSQRALMEQALQGAGVSPDDVCYIETHGTGTPLGDPIEVAAIREAFSSETRAAQRRPLYLGAVKSAIGHLEGAAGIAGLVKAVGVMSHRQLPPNLHYRSLNPYIDLKDASGWIRIPTDVVDLANADSERRPLVCGVSGFGFGGTNAHVVLQSYDGGDQRKVETRTETQPSVQPIDKVAFLFPGQGCQFVGMGQKLFGADRAFADAVERCDRIMQEQRLLDGKSLIRDVLWPSVPQDPPLVEDARFTQPAIFAIEYGLAEALAARGIRPAAVLGHSFGEFAAAVTAGIMTLEDAAKLVAVRARVAADMVSTGAMFLIHAPAETVQKAVDLFHQSNRSKDQVAIAATNGPRMTNIAGTEEACEAVCKAVRAPKVRLAIPHAFHSPLMEPLREHMSRDLQGVRLAAPSLRFFPTVAGHTDADTSKPSSSPAREAEYWLDQVVRGVDFMAGMRRLAEAGFDTFVEIGPRPTLIKMGQRCVTADAQGPQRHWVAALHDEGPEAELPLDHLEQLAKMLSEKKQSGQKMKVQGGARRFWRPLPHRIVKQVVPTSEKGVFTFERKLGRYLGKLLEEHRVNGIAVVPGALYIDTALALFAGARSIRAPEQGPSPVLTDANVSSIELHDLVFERPLQLPTAMDLGGLSAKQGIIVEGRLALSATEGTVRIASRAIENPATATPHFSCTVSKLAGRIAASAAIDIAALTQGLLHIGADTVYEASAGFGVEYGTRFRCIEELWKGEGVAVARLRAPRTDNGFLLDVGMLDGALQTAAFTVEREQAYMPFSVESVTVKASIANAGQEYYSIARLRGREQNMVAMDITLVDARGTPVVEVRSMKSRAAPRQDSILKKSVYEVEWVPLPTGVERTNHFQGDMLLMGTPEGSVNETWIRKLASSLGMKPKFVDATKVSGQEFSRAGLVVVAPAAPPSENDMIPATETTVEQGLISLQAALRALSTVESADEVAPVCLITHNAVPAGSGKVNPAHATLWGLARSARVEYTDLTVATIDVDDAAVSGNLHGLVCIMTQHRSTWGQGEAEFAVRGDNVLVPRMVESFAEGCRLPQQLAWRQASQAGGLSSLTWIPLAEPRAPGPGSVLLQVKAVGLNFKDVLTATGVDVDAVDVGTDCAGIVRAIGQGVTGISVGDDVFGIAPGCFKDLVIARADRLTSTPARLTAYEAATLPSAYLTARLALLDAPSIRPGDRVLVHAASGAVGQALVRLAHQHGCTVYATAGSEAKREYLLKQLGVAAVFPSRDAAAFQRELRAYLAREGGTIDVVVNSLADAYIPNSVSFLRHGGRFVEIGRKSIWTAEQMRAHRPDIEYRIVELDKLHSQPGSVAQHLAEVASLVDQGSLEPIISEVFPRIKVVEAFRRMQRALHIGKVVVSIEDVPDTRASADILSPARIQPESVERAVSNISSRAAADLGVPVDEIERGWRALSLYCFQQLRHAAQRVGPSGVVERQRRLYQRYCRGDPTQQFSPNEEAPLGLDGIADAYPFLVPQVEMLRQVDGHHEAVFRGTTDPLTLLFSGGASKRIAQDLYEKGIFARFCNQVAADVTGYLAGSLMPGATMKMLEVGAGTGGTTSRVLPKLGDAVQSYHFTDLSTSFLRHAEKRFAAQYRYVNYHLFDVEKDPVPQGVRSQSFDVVLACNVLHATKDLTRTLTHVRQILKHGGYLVLSEVTAPSYFADATFGMTSGWWLFADLELRPDYPLLTAQRWRSFLLNTIGFEHVWMSEQGGPLHNQSVIVARTPSASAISPRIPRPLSTASTNDRNSVVVLAGGLGGLGVLTARLLLKRGWKRFAFLSRSGEVPADATSEWKHFTAGGPQHRIYRCDVADRSAVERVLNEVRQQQGPIVGIVQAAGVLDSATLPNQDMARFRALMGPKVAGSWNLHLATQRDPIRFFALFSSMASVLGSAGQANHAACNSFMDALAAHRRAQGLPAVSIQFSSVSAVGEAARRRADLRHTIGYLSIPKLLARNGIEALVDSDAVAVALSPIDWAKMLAKYRVPPNLFQAFFGRAAPANASGVAEKQAASRKPAVRQQDRKAKSDSTSKKAAATSRRAQKKTPKEKKATAVKRSAPPPTTDFGANHESEARTLVVSAFREVLGYEPPRDDMGWKDAGVDSLLSIELRNAICARLDDLGVSKKVPVTFVFDYPTVRQAVGFLAAAIASSAGAASVEQATVEKRSSSSRKPNKPRKKASKTPNANKKPEAPKPAGVESEDFLSLVLESWQETISTPIRPKQAFVDCGLDSLSSVELLFALQTRLEDRIQLPENLVMQQPTPQDVASWLLQRIGSNENARSRTTEASPSLENGTDHMALIIEAWRSTVGTDLGADDDFVEAGLDSLSSVELLYALQQAVGESIEVPEGIFLSQKTPRALASWLNSKLPRSDMEHGTAPAVIEHEEISEDIESEESGDTSSSESDEIWEESDQTESKEESDGDNDEYLENVDKWEDAERIVHSAIEDVLGYSIDSNAPFTDSGVDSLSSLEIRNALQAKVPSAIKVPATAVFDYPSVQKLAGFLSQRMAELERANRPTTKPSRSAKPQTNKPVAKAKSSRSKAPKQRVEKGSRNKIEDTEDPIVIVGMASRFPGQTDDRVEGWFEWLLDGKDAFVEIPHHRFDIDEVYHPGGESRAGKSYVRDAAFVHGAEMFDHAHFGIVEAEAAKMDPQQRLLLETSFQALHCSGYTKQSLDGLDIGVFVGCCSNDWSKMPEARGSAFSGTGAAASILSNRVSYALNLCAPSMTIDTACSSALVALDAAASALKLGKCRAAVVSAVNLMLSYGTFVTECEASMLSPSGKCRAFDSRADGFARGEGCGSVVVKKLSQARADGDEILAVLAATAINQDGRSAGLTAPNGPSQEAVIRSAIGAAGLRPEQLIHLESHGTATKLGDGIEWTALANVFGDRSSREPPLYVGSVKANVGHLEGAAGMAGLIKSVMILRSGKIPPQANFETLNPLFETGHALAVPTKLTSLDGIDLSKFACGISSFGFGGTNAHAIVRLSTTSEVPHSSLGTHRLLRTPWPFDGRKYIPWRPSDSPFVTSKVFRDGDRWAVYRVALGERLRKDLLAQHRVRGTIIVPAAAIIEMTRAALEAHLADESAGLELVELILAKAILVQDVSPASPVFLQCATLANGEDSGKSWHIETECQGEVILHATAAFGRCDGGTTESTLDVEDASMLHTTLIKPSDFYRRAADRGLEYGPLFQALTRIAVKRDGSSAFVKIGGSQYETSASPASTFILSRNDYFVPPHLCDAAFQACSLLHREDAANQTFLPFQIGQVRWHTTRDQVDRRPKYAICERQGGGPDSLVASVAIYDQRGELLLSVGNFVAQAIQKSKESLDVIGNAAGRAQEGTDQHMSGSNSGVSESRATAVIPKRMFRESLQLVPASRSVGSGTGFTRFALIRSSSGRPTPRELLRLPIPQVDVHPTHNLHQRLSSLSGIEGLLFAPPPRLNDPDGDGSLEILEVVKALDRMNVPVPLTIIDVTGVSTPTRDSRELPDLKIFLWHVDPTLAQRDGFFTSPPALQAASLLPLEQELFTDANGQYTPRLQPIAPMEKEVIGLECQVGADAEPDFGHLRIVPLRRQPGDGPGPDEVEVQVRAVGLNFRDVLNAMGLNLGVPGPLGADCAGVVSRVGSNVQKWRVGDEVLGIARGCLRSYAITNHRRLIAKPTDMTFEQAASVASVYATVYQSFVDVARLRAGQTVLVHAAAGGVGLFAIQLAKHLGASIIATVGSPEKEKLVRSYGVQLVSSSRDVRKFETDMAQWRVRPDVVLNCLTGDFIRVSLDFLAPSGLFIELGKREIWTQEQVCNVRPDVQFAVVAIDKMLAEDPQAHADLLLRVERELLAGWSQPLPIQKFAFTDVAKAFSSMRRGQHVGKVVLSLEHATLSNAAGGSVLSTVPNLERLLRTGMDDAMAEFFTTEFDRTELLAGLEAVDQIARTYLQDCMAAATPSQVTPHLRALYDLYRHQRPSYGVANGAADVKRMYRSVGARVDFLEHVRREHLAMLTADTDPVSVLFSDPELTKRLYDESPLAALFNKVISGALKSVAAETGRLKAIEIGAGTGGTTRSVCDVLGSLCRSFCFTDISTSFFNRAQQEFAPSIPGFHTALLDIERDPEHQGFILGSYDLILAANVLHATADLSVTLANIHALLKPDGILVLSELTDSSVWADATFGFTKGWWLSTDDRRSSGRGPLISLARWNDAFRRANLEPVTSSDETIAAQTIMVARRPLHPLNRFRSTIPSAISQRARSASSAVDEGVYVITGGTGGLGLLSAHILILEGARSIALLSRSGAVPGEAEAELWALLQRSRCQISIHRCDVSDEVQLRRIFDSFGVPVVGIIHAAGHLSDASIGNQSTATFGTVMRTKASGLLNLHRLSMQHPVKMFVVFSSASAFFGSAGQTNHAAANSFMDGLVRWRRRVGLPASSIMWGAVSQVGDAARRGADRRNKMLYDPLSLVDAAEVLSTVLFGDLDVVLAAPIRPASISSDYRGNKRIFGSLIPSEDANTANGTQETIFRTPEPVPRPQPVLESQQKTAPSTSASKHADYDRVLSTIRSLATKYIGRQPADDELLVGAGLDSLSAIDLRNSIQAKLLPSGTRLPASTVFDHPSAADLARLSKHFLQAGINGANTSSDGTFSGN
ncbi:Phthiocerol/phenolphthiocerol synthesis polyketide synthase type I PpsC [Lasiodiplodia theobromae]|uniref:Phthiocerol/phenolphthiocerol synthesis polyketide synthase type I PpsC n=1 Tax=Lasiodiplodia theobromae TaxID=45133 RepID=A0A5N5DEV3_9PEZI|nr:Phthiocerol/phenolphthiocerol synthesis polyketide synthase type I PpsC [Lasiodiplodia theobromae]